MGNSGAVTASSAAASSAGTHILRAGGNAVDAAVATALASCVADPCNTGLGGFGRTHRGRAGADGRRRADLHRFQCLGAGRRGRDLSSRERAGPSRKRHSECGRRTVARIGRIRQHAVGGRGGTRIALAEEGFACGPTLLRALEDVRGAPFVAQCFRFETASTEACSVVRLRQPALARTLKLLAAEGPRWFYEGPVAASGCSALRVAGHNIEAGDWANAIEAVTVAPAPALRVGTTELFSAPLGTSGSLCMFAIAAAGFALARADELDTPAGAVRLARQIASAWSYRFGDARGNIFRTDELEPWIERAAAFQPAAAIPAAGGHTCHLNAADGTGMMAAATLTHGKLWFGARWAMPGSGVIMNYGSPAFSDAPAQIVDGRARGVTNTNPTIGRLDDGAMVAIGTPGARRIASIVALVLARHVGGGMALPAAIARGRFHAEDASRATLEPDRLPQEFAAALQGAFASVEAEGPLDYYGPCTAIRRDSDGAMTLGLDDRWPGLAPYWRRPLRNFATAA